ncbi:hypothetical protein ERJ75_000064600 [Trypanosoma vivax]|nr:hypothetical protein TRVL_02387 [Trypanosoma vivax]KAH8620651.1 hypothetical protein ERJ75_000064600 [Trypanosoma vivax]
MSRRTQWENVRQEARTKAHDVLSTPVTKQRSTAGYELTDKQMEVNSPEAPDTLYPSLAATISEPFPRQFVPVPLDPSACERPADYTAPAAHIEGKDIALLAASLKSSSISRLEKVANIFASSSPMCDREVGKLAASFADTGDVRIGRNDNNTTSLHLELAQEKQRNIDAEQRLLAMDKEIKALRERNMRLALSTTDGNRTAANCDAPCAPSTNAAVVTTACGKGGSVEELLARLQEEVSATQKYAKSLEARLTESESTIAQKERRIRQLERTIANEMIRRGATVEGEPHSTHKSSDHSTAAWKHTNDRRNSCATFTGSEVSAVGSKVASLHSVSSIHSAPTSVKKTEKLVTLSSAGIPDSNSHAEFQPHEHTQSTRVFMGERLSRSATMERRPASPLVRSSSKQKVGNEPKKEGITRTTGQRASGTKKKAKNVPQRPKSRPAARMSASSSCSPPIAAPSLHSPSRSLTPTRASIKSSGKMMSGGTNRAFTPTPLGTTSITRQTRSTPKTSSHSILSTPTRSMNNQQYCSVFDKYRREQSIAQQSQFRPTLLERALSRSELNRATSTTQQQKNVGLSAITTSRRPRPRLGRDDVTETPTAVATVRSSTTVVTCSVKRRESPALVPRAEYVEEVPSEVPFVSDKFSETTYRPNRLVRCNQSAGEN